MAVWFIQQNQVEFAPPADIRQIYAPVKIKKPIDIFDLFYHSAPLILLMIKTLKIIQTDETVGLYVKRQSAQMKMTCFDRSHIKQKKECH